MENPTARSHRLGIQILADMYECHPGVLDDENAIRSCLLEAARRAGATIVTDRFHRFNPHGISGIVVIAESHLAIHTWPEHGFAALDLFTCGDTMNADACFSYVKAALHSQRQTMQVVERGLRAQVGRETMVR